MKNRAYYINSKRIHFVTLGVLFILINIAIYLKFGIKVVSDSHRYLEWSQSPFSQFSATNWKFYSLSYICFLAFTQWLGVGMKGVVLIQMIVSAFACFSLYQLTLDISKSTFAAFLASFFYLAFGEILQWNTYVLTESLFTSGIIFIMYGLHRADRVNNAIILIPLGVFVCLIRPMGITVFFSVLIFLFFKFKIHKNLSFAWKLIGILAFIVTGCIMFYFLLEGNPSVNFYYSRGQIVWGTDTPEFQTNSWLILENENVVYPSKELPSYQMFFAFVRDNFSFFSELFFKKMTLFIGHIKPYYSTWHNIYILLFLTVTYSFGFLHIFKLKKHHSVAWFALSLIILNMLMVGFSVEAWDGRFLIPVLSPIFVFAGIGLSQALIKNKYFT